MHSSKTRSNGWLSLSSSRYLLHRPLYNHASAGASQDTVSAIKVESQYPARVVWHGKLLDRGTWVVDGPQSDLAARCAHQNDLLGLAIASEAQNLPTWALHQKAPVRCAYIHACALYLTSTSQNLHDGVLLILLLHPPSQSLMLSPLPPAWQYDWRCTKVSVG